MNVSIMNDSNRSAIVDFRISRLRDFEILRFIEKAETGANRKIKKSQNQKLGLISALVEPGNEPTLSKAPSEPKPQPFLPGVQMLR
jgi:hypothetical protein